jgi:hypothetical protein
MESLIDEANNVTPCILYMEHFESFFQNSQDGRDSSYLTWNLHYSKLFLDETIKADIEHLLKLRTTPKNLDSRNNLLVVCSANDIDKVPESIRSIFRHEIAFEVNT